MTATVLNTKIIEVENNIQDTSSLVTTTVPNRKIAGVENKIPYANGLVKKTDSNSKISDIEKKFFITSDYDKFMSKTLDAKIREKRLLNKFNISNLAKNPELNIKHATVATKAELEVDQDKIVKCRAFDSSYFLGKSYFEYDLGQNYLAFSQFSDI